MGWWKDCSLELPKESGYYKTRIYYRGESCRDILTVRSVIMYYDKHENKFRVCDNDRPYRYTDLRRTYEVVKTIAWRYNFIRSIINSIFRLN